MAQKNRAMLSNYIYISSILQFLYFCKRILQILHYTNLTIVIANSSNKPVKTETKAFWASSK